MASAVHLRTLPNPVEINRSDINNTAGGGPQPVNIHIYTHPKKSPHRETQCEKMQKMGLMVMIVALAVFSMFTHSFETFMIGAFALNMLTNMMKPINMRSSGMGTDIKMTMPFKS